MSITLLADVSNQIGKFWSPTTESYLKEKTQLASIVNRSYEGEIRQGGDTVYVSALNRPTADSRTLGTNDEYFTSSKMSTTRVALTIEKRLTAAFKVADLVSVQTQLKEGDSAIRKALQESLEIALNDYLFSKVSPSTSSPDHSVSGCSDFNAAQFLSTRLLASQAKWPDEDRYMFLDPSYYNDFLNATTLTSADYVSDAPVVAGKAAVKRFGFWVVEDNSAGMVSATMSPAAAGADTSLAFHKDFMYLAMGPVNFQVSSLHASEQHGYLISADMWCGASLGIQGNVKHIVTYNS